MSDTDSFIDEVTEEVRRDQLFLMLKKYGWIGGVAVVLIVGGAAIREYGKSEDRAAADDKARQVVDKLRGLRLTRAAELVEASVHETLAYYAFPEEHWRRIRTNDPLERILREIKRRTKVVGAFPDGNSALNLAAARLRHIAGTPWSAKRYLNMQLLKATEITNATA